MNLLQHDTRHECMYPRQLCCCSWKNSSPKDRSSPSWPRRRGILSFLRVCRCLLRATCHTSQGPWPWNGEGPCLSSKGRSTMGIGKAILCRDGPSNIRVWSENGPCWGTTTYLIGGKCGATYLTQWSGRFLGIISWILMFASPTGLHVDILWFFFIKLGYILQIPLNDWWFSCNLEL